VPLGHNRLAPLDCMSRWRSRRRRKKIPGAGILPVVLAFTVDVPEAVLEDLQRRLERTRWPDDLDGGDRAYGPGVAFMAALVEHWRTRFDWRAHERALNQVPQFIEAIDGTRIHFAHLRGRGPAPLPVVITHRWPGSFVEMLDVAAQLADPAAHGASPLDAFDVIVPSIPGFGFSSWPAALGMNLPRIADLWVGLMDRLGYASIRCAGRRLRRVDRNLDRHSASAAAARAAPELHPRIVRAACV
jgi:hypothetical protein